MALNEVKRRLTANACDNVQGRGTRHQSSLDKGQDVQCRRHTLSSQGDESVALVQSEDKAVSIGPEREVDWEDPKNSEKLLGALSQLPAELDPSRKQRAAVGESNDEDDVCQEDIGSL
jgi:hypothetical protein